MSEPVSAVAHAPAPDSPPPAPRPVAQQQVTQQPVAPPRPAALQATAPPIVPPGQRLPSTPPAREALQQAKTELAGAEPLKRQPGIPFEFEQDDPIDLELDLGPPKARRSSYAGSTGSFPPVSGAGMPQEFEPDVPLDLEVDLPPRTSRRPPAVAQYEQGGLSAGMPSRPPAQRPSYSGDVHPRAHTGAHAAMGSGVVVESLFWERLPFAFIAPLMGKAWILLFFAGLVPAAWVLLQMSGARFLTGIVSTIVVYLLCIGIFVETFARLAQEGADNDEGWPRPSLANTEVGTLLFVGFIATLVSFALFGLPMRFVQNGTLPAALLPVLLLLPYVYWPMALAVQGLSGRPFAMLNVLHVVRCMFRAPLKYIVVVVVGIGLTFGVGIGMAVVGALVMAADLGVGVVLGIAALSAAMAYVHGVLGYAMGRMVSADDDLAELIER